MIDYQKRLARMRYDKEGYTTYVNALLQNQEGEFLILRRSRTAPWEPNKWNLPAGKVEYNESPIDALARELTEELNLDKEVLQFYFTGFIDNDKEKYTNLYYQVYVREPEKLGIMTINYEHDGLDWANVQTLGKFLCVPFLQRDLMRLLGIGEVVSEEVIYKAFDDIIGTYSDDLEKAITKGTHKKDNPDYEPIMGAGGKVVGYRKKGSLDVKTERHKKKVAEAGNEHHEVGTTVSFKNKKGETVVGKVKKHGQDHKEKGKLYQIETDHGTYTRYHHNVEKVKTKEDDKPTSKPTDGKAKDDAGKAKKGSGTKPTEKPTEEKKHTKKELRKHAEKTSDEKLQKYIAKQPAKDKKVDVAREELDKREEEETIKLATTFDHNVIADYSEKLDEIRKQGDKGNVYWNDGAIDSVEKYGLADHEASAVMAYVTSSTFSPLNTLLRKTDEELGANSFLAKYRKEGMAFAKIMTKALDKLPKFSGTVHRVLEINQSEYNRLVGEYEENIGNAYAHEAFTSASKIEGFNINHSASDTDKRLRFKIDTKAVADLHVTKFNVREEEVVFKPGTQFKVKNVIKQGNEHIIHLEHYEK